eukprot:3949031-Amphidinium_carterae.1
MLCTVVVGSRQVVDWRSTCFTSSWCALLQSAGRQVEVRKYVDDMVVVAAGPYFAHYLRDSYRDVLKALKQGNYGNMQVNPKKMVVVCNGTHTKNKLKRAWRAGLLPPVRITTRDLVVDTHWVSWRNPVQRKRLRTFEQSMTWVRALGLPARM